MADDILTQTDSKTVRATETALEILEVIQREDGAGVTELANQLDLSKAAVHHHLATLREKRYVIKRASTYHVGLRFLGLGGQARTNEKIYAYGKREIDDLATEIEESAQIVVEEHGKGIFLYRSLDKHGNSIETYLGMEIDLHCTASGKAILAHTPDERRSSIIDRYGLPRHTKNTITDKKTLREELQDIRESDVAFDDQEQLVGIRCVAAPVRSPTGALLGAISVSAPVERMDDERFRDTVPNLVQNTAGVIEANVGYARW